MRGRVLFLCVSLLLVIVFTGLVVAGREAKEGLFQALGNLAEVVHLMRTEYVEELNPEALELSLDAGIVESVDRWAAVLREEEVDAFEKSTRSPPPYGLVLTSRIGSAAVRQVVPGSPAAAAGLQRWEVIERVEGAYTRGRPLWHVRLELADREQAGKPVSLTVMDEQVEERRDLVLAAEPWQVEPVVLDQRGEVVVVRMDSLSEGSAQRVSQLVPQQSRLVLDLRGLTWGVAEEAIAVADLFVADGTLGGWRGRRTGSRIFEATAPTLVALPPAVLVGPDTEGVGEILAAALQRNGSPLVGSRTAGYAPQMTLIRGGGINLWIPTALWLRGDGEPINDRGIDPNEIVEETGDAGSGDPVLDRALELIAEPAVQAA